MGLLPRRARGAAAPGPAEPYGGALAHRLREGGRSPTEKQAPLPHHQLIAYQLALELVKLVVRTRIGEAQLRAQARKSATSAALNTAEGAALTATTET